MFNVEGMSYITNMREVSPKLLTCDVYTFKKVSEKEFKTTFLKAKVVGEALTFVYANNIKNKDKIYIESSILENNSYTNKEGVEVNNLNLTIFKLSLLEKKEVKDNNKSKFDR